MRWLVLLVVVIIGLLFLYDRGDWKIKFGPETPVAPVPAAWPGPITTQVLLPPAARIKGTWIRVGGSERLTFGDDGRLHKNYSNVLGYSYQFTDNGYLQIVWGRAGGGQPFVRDYSYEFKDNTLILTQDTDGRFIYMHDSEPIEFGRQVSKNVGPNPVTISGRLVGPEGVLANQPITLERYDHHGLSKVATIPTDTTGQYKFPNVEPESFYDLSFVFSTANPNQIPDGALIKTNGWESFVLSKGGLEITATINSFYLHGFEGEIIIDFVYPSTSPPTVTPLPPTATPVLTPTVPPTSTSDQGIQVIPAPTSPSTPIVATGTSTASVPSNVVWVDTGRMVGTGQSLAISASDSINLLSGDPAHEHIPDGSKSIVLCQDIKCLMREVPYGKLIGKIGEGKPFEVGDNLETLVTVGGTLYLAVNDHYFDDNIGAYHVTITVTLSN